jgi:hypothetical protein
MKRQIFRRRYLMLNIAATLLVSLCLIHAEVPAFPGAEGFGMYAKGGRGGKVLFVTNLRDYGRDESPIPGSLRAAVETDGPRTIVFRVSGLLALK